MLADRRRMLGPDHVHDSEALDEQIARASAALAARQQPDGHWVFELEADATIPAEYILLRHYLGEPVDAALEARIAKYLRRIQGPHGGWSLYHGGSFDVSATVKAYYALKMSGDTPDLPHMACARAAVLAAGGAGAVNVFTRIQLALFAAGPWDAVPEMPPELMLLPRWFPIHLSKMSYWARTVLVPLLVLMTLRPVAVNALGHKVDELYTWARSPRAPAKGAQRYTRAGFETLDAVLKRARPFWPAGSRAKALAACEAFVTERLNGQDGLGAIYPAIANSAMMYAALGYAPDHALRATARDAVERLLVHRDNGETYCQPCMSPVWDTALAAHAMLEAGGEANVARAGAALDWLRDRQVLDVKGDWADERPDVRPGGWAFQYANAHYPDTDDTAVVAMAMDRAAGDYAEPLARAREWIEGMQSANGGWGAFDIDNDKHYLNHIPFADHGALLDPPTEDVTARCVSMLAQLGEPADSPRMMAALNCLRDEQLDDGSWWGRWGVNYIYGTWSALCALNAAGRGADDPAVARAAGWLTGIQNTDGGWGESADSYKLDYTGYEPAPSTASQTAWALLGLMAAGMVSHPAVLAGVRWLQREQAGDGLWGQEHYTGGGFPRVFYLRYHGYPAYFPLWALARYRNLTAGNSQHVSWGM